MPEPKKMPQYGKDMKPKKDQTKEEETPVEEMPTEEQKQQQITIAQAITLIDRNVQKIIQQSNLKFDEHDIKIMANNKNIELSDKDRNILWKEFEHLEKDVKTNQKKIEELEKLIYRQK